MADPAQGRRWTLSNGRPERLIRAHGPKITDSSYVDVMPVAEHDRVVQELREQVEEARLASQMPRTNNIAYDLKQRLNRAVRYLRDAEDIARIEMPGWPTADRIRSIYERVTADVLTGKTTVAPIAQRLAEAEAALAEVTTAAREVVAADQAPNEDDRAWVDRTSAAFAVLRAVLDRVGTEDKESQ